MQPLRRPHVLVVDDEPGTVEVLMMVLGEAGFLVSGAADGHEAMAAMAANRPDVVVLDLLMPGLDGGEVLRAMAADPRLANIPVLVMSGVEEKTVRRRCARAAQILRKPFSLGALLRAVRSIVPAGRG